MNRLPAVAIAAFSLALAVALVWSGVAYTRSADGVDALDTATLTSRATQVGDEQEDDRDDDIDTPEADSDGNDTPPPPDRGSVEAPRVSVAQTITLRTAPEPTPAPTSVSEATLAPRPHPAPEDQDDDTDSLDTPETDGDGFDTEANTDHDGVDTPETDGDGFDTEANTDHDGVDTPETDGDGFDTEANTDHYGVDTPETDGVGLDAPDANGVTLAAYKEDGAVQLAYSNASLSVIPGKENSSPETGVSARQSGTTPALSDSVFDTGASYSVFTRYGSATEIALADYLVTGATGNTFTLKSCDDSRGDYYSSAIVQNGKLLLQSNTVGHVHGPNTQGETVCTVIGTGENGSEEQEFRLYTVSDRTPVALLPGPLTLVETRPSELDIQISVPGGSLGYLRLGWRKAGGQPSFGVLSGVNSETVVTIPSLEAGTEYDIRAYLMSAQAFDLYRASNSGSPGELIPEGNPDSKWVANLSSGGLGKSQAITLRTASLPTPTPTPRPKPRPEPTLAPTPRPTLGDEDDDTDGIDTPETDGIDTPPVTDGIDTPDPDSNDDDDSDDDSD